MKNPNTLAAFRGNSVGDVEQFIQEHCTANNVQPLQVSAYVLTDPQNKRTDHCAFVVFGPLEDAE